MKCEHCATSNVVFKSARSISFHSFASDEAFTACVEVSDGHVSFTLDHSQYFFTAQQAVEVAKNLTQMLLAYAKLGEFQSGWASISQLEAYTSWYPVIEARTLSTVRDSMQVYVSETKGFEFIASGSFRSPESFLGELDCYRIEIGFDGDLDLPCIGIEDRIFRLSFEETFWLVEQLWVAGYLVAQIEKPVEYMDKGPWISEEGRTIWNDHES